VRWPSDCEDVSPEAEVRPLLEVATKQWLVKTEKTLCVVTVIFRVSNSLRLY
jgi:hypothetical protein